ncbi:MAG: hypothetical protein ACXQTR_00865 [Candidatus Methanospirareceae archaeon]
MNTDLKNTHSGPASYGVLGDCLLEADILMSILGKTVDKIEVTGQLKHKYLNAHSLIELLAIPKTSPDMFGEPRHNTEMHYLLIDTLHDSAWINDEPPNYEWQGKRYQWKLTTLKNETQWALAQIIHSGPDYFTQWLTSPKLHRGGLLPWGYTINDYTLFNNSKEPIAIWSESDFWLALDYLPISLEDRANGDPAFWRGFKLV